MYFNQKSILAADYLRLSREDGDKLESDSIRNQRSLINDFVKQHPDITLVDEYIDDGYSGTNFERPAFKRLLEDVKKKKINCIIVKDLSRLGRNYIETGRYLEKIFPFLGVRFIAITDHYDSAAESDDADQIIVPFKNLINDAYCRDISIKIRSQLDVKRKNGQFIGSFAGYGYQKDPENKNHLIIDEYAAEIMKQQLTDKVNRNETEMERLTHLSVEESTYKNKVASAIELLDGEMQHEKITQELVDATIDTVYVYDKKRIEVVFKFDDILMRAIEKYQKGEKEA